MEANTLSGTPENATKIAPPECGPVSYTHLSAGLPIMITITAA